MRSEVTAEKSLIAYWRKLNQLSRKATKAVLSELLIMGALINAVAPEMAHAGMMKRLFPSLNPDHIGSFEGSIGPGFGGNRFDRASSFSCVIRSVLDYVRGFSCRSGI